MSAETRQAQEQQLDNPTRMTHISVSLFRDPDNYGRVAICGATLNGNPRDGALVDCVMCLDIRDRVRGA